MSAKANNQAVYMHPKTIMPVNGVTFWRVLLFVASAALLGWGAYVLQKPETLPIQKIHAIGTFSKINEEMLRGVVATSIDAGYFAVDVAEVKRAVEALPWVHKASVSRIWPDTLSINVIEEKASAIWARGGLVNQLGEIFVPEKNSYPDNLPVFDGPVGKQRNMTEFYKQASSIIEPLQVKIVRLHFDSRGAITIYLSNNIEVLLGREKAENRLQRFVRVFKKVLINKVNEIASIDMRYSNGLAVGWKKLN